MDVLFNPDCSKCIVLGELLDELAIPWNRIAYLTGDLTADLLASMARISKQPLTAFLRAGESIPESEDPIEHLLGHPEKLQRPIVLSEEWVLIARPPHLVLEALPKP